MKTRIPKKGAKKHMSRIDHPASIVADFFSWLIAHQLIVQEDILCTNDGFRMVNKPLSAILISRGIETFPDREGNILECRLFFDDWFLFAVTDSQKNTYGLLKMREQEYDKKLAIPADGDVPGVTVSFVALDIAVLVSCLLDPSSENRKQIGMEINRVVAYPKQNHHPDFKQYFIRPESEAAYLIAEVYIKRIASFCVNGRLPVPEVYLEIFQKRTGSKKHARVPDFLEQNNRNAGCVVCDHQYLYLADPDCLSEFERLAILAVHTGNVSVHSFAAEIRYHALFLTKLAKLRIPRIGSPYASAVRADMSIGDKEFQGPTPYYHLSGRLVKTQETIHGNLKYSGI